MNKTRKQFHQACLRGPEHFYFFLYFSYILPYFHFLQSLLFSHLLLLPLLAFPFFVHLAKATCYHAVPKKKNLSV